jgi:hypothetical protein
VTRSHLLIHDREHGPAFTNDQLDLIEELDGPQTGMRRATCPWPLTGTSGRAHERVTPSIPIHTVATA